MSRVPTRRTAGGAWPERAVGVVLGSAAGWLVVATLTRVRVHLGTGLGTEQPVRWFLLGFAGDALVAAVALIAGLAGRRARVPRAAIVGAALLVATLLQIAWSEFALYFGQPVQPENLQLGFHPRIVLGAAQGRVLWILVGGIGLFIACAAWAAWRRWRIGTAAVAVAALLLIVGGGIGLAALRQTHRAELTQNALLMAWRLGTSPGGAREGELVPVVHPDRPRTAARRLAPQDGRRYISDAYPLAWVGPDGARLVPPLVSKPNLVIVLLEGIRARDVAAFGGGPEALMPNLSRIARAGIRFDAMYSTGSFTPEGEIACWYGLLASPYEIVIRTRPEVRLTGLPELLRAAGWKEMLWIHPGDQTLYLSSRFYEHRGFRVIDGRDFPPSDPVTNWGYSDRALFRRAVDLFDRAAQPFAGMVLTVSNHHPYQLPEDAEDDYEAPEEETEEPEVDLGQFAGKHSEAMARTVHYTDEALGAFFEQARSRPWFANTVFLILGDHGSPVPPPEGIASEREMTELRHRVPAAFYSPLLREPMRIAGPSSQADLMPTLLGLFGIPQPWPGVGADLLVQGSAPRPIVSWVMNGHRLSVIRGDDAYLATAVRAEDGSGWRLENESVVDRETGAPSDADLGELRADALAFLEDYPAVVAEGISGLPED